MANKKTDAILTRAKGLNGSLAQLLRADGVSVSEMPLLKAMPDASGCRRLVELIQLLGPEDWVALTSPTAARLFCLIICHRPRCKVASLGRATSEALMASGLRVDMESDLPTAMDLGRALVSHGVAGRRIVLPRSDLADSDFPELLAAAGANVTPVITYQMQPDRESADQLVALFRGGEQTRPGAVVLASGSAVTELANALERNQIDRDEAIGDGKTALVTIGPRTTAVATALGLPVGSEARHPGDAGLREAVLRVLGRSMLLLLALIVLPVELLAGAPDPGPFGATSRAPMRMLRLDPAPASALPGDRHWIAAQFEYSSIFQFETGFQPGPGETDPQMVQFDAELATLVLSGEFQFDLEPLPYGLRLGGSFTLMNYSAGFLDSFLEDYHDLLGVPNLGKELQPRNRFLMRLRDRNGAVAWEAESGGIRGGNLVTWATLPFWRYQSVETLFGAAARVNLMLPTGSDRAGVGVNGAEVSAGMIISAQQERFAADLSLDLISNGGADFRGVPGYRTRPYLKGMVAARYRVFDRLWVGGQLIASGSPMKTPLPLRTIGKPSWLLTFGGQWQASERVWIDFGMNEDMNHAEIDFTAFIRFRILF